MADDGLGLRELPPGDVWWPQGVDDRTLPDVRRLMLMWIASHCYEGGHGFVSTQDVVRRLHPEHFDRCCAVSAPGAWLNAEPVPCDAHHLTPLTRGARPCNPRNMAMHRVRKLLVKSVEDGYLDEDKTAYPHTWSPSAAWLYRIIR